MKAPSYKEIGAVQISFAETLYIDVPSHGLHNSMLKVGSSDSTRIERGDPYSVVIGCCRWGCINWWGGFVSVIIIEDVIVVRVVA